MDQFQTQFHDFHNRRVLDLERAGQARAAEEKNRRNKNLGGQRQADVWSNAIECHNRDWMCGTQNKKLLFARLMAAAMVPAIRPGAHTALAPLLVSSLDLDLVSTRMPGCTGTHVPR